MFVCMCRGTYKRYIENMKKTAHSYAITGIGKRRWEKYSLGLRHSGTDSIYTLDLELGS